jgi:hypothetical protein
LFACFDEFKFQNSESERLKSIISGDTEMLRLPYSKDVQTVPIYTSFFATTNKKGNEVVTDETGARRFYSLYVDRDKETFRQMVNSFDYRSFIFSIDPACDGFYFGKSNIRKRISFIDFLKSEVLQDLILDYHNNLYRTGDTPLEVEVSDNELRIDKANFTKRYKEFCSDSNWMYGKQMTYSKIQEDVLDKIGKDQDVTQQLSELNITDIKVCQARINGHSKKALLFTFTDSPLKIMNFDDGVIASYGGSYEE